MRGMIHAVGSISSLIDFSFFANANRSWIHPGDPRLHELPLAACSDANDTISANVSTDESALSLLHAVDPLHPASMTPFDDTIMGPPPSTSLVLPAASIPGPEETHQELPQVIESVLEGEAIASREAFDRTSRQTTERMAAVFEDITSGRFALKATSSVVEVLARRMEHLSTDRARTDNQPSHNSPRPAYRCKDCGIFKESLSKLK